jgi:hypothetical protein
VVTSATPWRGGIDTRRACAVTQGMECSDLGRLNCAPAKIVTRQRWEMQADAHLALMRDSEVRADQSFNRRSVVSGQFKFRAIS